MSPLAAIWAPKRGSPTTHTVPAEDLTLRVHVSRASETTATPTLDSRASSTPTITVTSPSAAHHSSRQLNDAALGEFFGGGRRSAHRTRTTPHTPPAYSLDWDGEKLPDYTIYSSDDVERDTVARHLFKYGFFFPLFWAIGVYFLFAPMRVSEDWQSDRTPEDKEKILSEMRETEVKWAKRCLWALLSFFVCLAIVIISVVITSR